MRPVLTIAACGLFGILAVADARQSPSQAAPQTQPPPPTFRSETTLVPVDVRVLDRTGKPITDLKREDFTVLENGVPHEIRYFSARGLVALPAEPGAKPAFRTRASPAVQEQQSRIFLIVLGRGRLQEPSKGLDGLIHFVRSRLLPQDQVAVMAYNRSTDFTNDHEPIVRLLDRYKRRHEQIETDLRHRFSGLEAVYGSREIPQYVQRQVDELFQEPGAVRSRQLVPASVSDAAAIAADTRRATDSALTAELNAARIGGARSVLDQIQAEMQPLPFDAYVSTSVQTNEDLGNLYTGIEYLRYLEGEKHLIFVSENGMNLPRGADSENALAARANHARVVIDTIQTGGLDPGPPPTASSPGPPIPSMNFTFMDMARISGLKNISYQTGGQSAARVYTRPAVDRIDATTRFGYLLGYHPSNTARDTRYRRIVVRVNRPGVTVLYRHGYFADDVPPPIDRRAFLIQRRLAAATYYTVDVPDIKLSAKATTARSSRGTDVSLDLVIDVSRVAFSVKDNRHVASLELALACGDAKERVIGRSRQTLDLSLKDDTFQRYSREGFPLSASLSMVAKPRYVKLVVYDYASDLVGSRTITLK